MTNISTIAIEISTSEEFIDRYRPKYLNEFMAQNGGTLAKTYSKERPFSLQLQLLPENGERTSYVVHALDGDKLVGLVQPSIGTTSSSMVESLPDGMRQAAYKMLGTNFGIYSLVVAEHMRHQNIATKMITACITGFLPQMLCKMRENPAGYINRMDRALFPDADEAQLTAHVLKSLEHPLLSLKGETPELLEMMTRIVSRYPKLYLPRKRMTAIESALVGGMLFPKHAGYVYPELDEEGKKTGLTLMQVNRDSNTKLGLAAAVSVVKRVLRIGTPDLPKNTSYTLQQHITTQSYNANVDKEAGEMLETIAQTVIHDEVSEDHYFNVGSVDPKNSEKLIQGFRRVAEISGVKCGEPTQEPVYARHFATRF